ncbi:ABC transporter [Cordyceps fumosorosea ARSEF 2679]|uniref:ABC multidrug transporter atrF n=1 Tax=Cordyceps fumosorosea (strain ARSEF 2679) TaxID=1081104 RepID=A0A168CA60_CORFA|nr:ABC transporter [Cordyceps fumosorosea ARSEF 2679]OAA71137.1 ABC transporter [Cordyceps fumosorosea ARSEF 2679]
MPPTESYDAGQVPAYNVKLKEARNSESFTTMFPSEDGRWGEQNQGDPVSHHVAMEEFGVMRRELSRQSLGQTRSGTAAHQTSSRMSQHQDDEEALGERSGSFDLPDFLEGGQLERRTTMGGAGKGISVAFKNVTVKGVVTGASFVRSFPDAVVGTFGPDLYRLITRFVPQLHIGRKPPVRDIIHDFNGILNHGEIMLVLRRPGAGCSTFLKAIANHRGTFAAVDGDISYGGISAEEQRKHFRGEISYHPEDDQHFPILTVWQTLKFSLLHKTRKNDSHTIPIVISSLLKMFGILHTKDTFVSNEFVRGVSGGERKRVSIAETLIAKSTVVCWDNSTRGLDASTAIDYAKSLRVMTDISRRTTFVTLYQVSESIYELMDKVMVIDSGRMLYQGPANKAKQYFVDLGFHCPEHSTTADFLTEICDPASRQYQPGREASTPKTVEEFEAVFRNSGIYKALLETVDKHFQDSNSTDALRFQKTVAKSKSKRVSENSSYTISLPRQVAACVKREFWLIMGDKTSLYTKYFSIITNALVVSSMFYGQPLDTSGAFSRCGAIFFSLFFFSWVQLAELMPAVQGRIIGARHEEYAFYRPSAVTIARFIIDIPSIFCMVVPFSLIMYFMTGLDVSVSKFFIFFLFVYSTTYCVTSMFRMFASLSPSFDDAIRFSGLALNLLFIFMGYVIPKSTLINDSIWFGWLIYLNPMSYSYEAVLASEFSDRTMECAPSQLIPQGPGIDPRYQGCALTGSQIGSADISGATYLKESFQFTRSNLWRNFGVVIAFTALYMIVTVIASETLSFVGGGGGALMFKKSKRTKRAAAQAVSGGDEEKTQKPGTTSVLSNGQPQSSGSDKSVRRLLDDDRVFTWTDVEYTVPIGNGTARKLLNGVSGYAKPGVMIALMGASGAGKTTLLNTLSQRQSMGIVGGEMQVNGHPLGPYFQREAGFCEQMDFHDTTATIYEALVFSAILRQDRNIPREEKIAYVDQVIDLLELGEIRDAIIGSLNIEQKKRVTIGVELAAKPSFLLFLDEPTSGLDSQAAISIVRFLKKLSQAGQAIVCTIHQPSFMLIQQFDMILALNPGGNTFYFGPIGRDGATVAKYFADRGVAPPPSKNIAEFILETAAKITVKEDGTSIDWDEQWKNSTENRALLDEIRQIREERRKIPLPGVGIQHEFAAPTSLQTIMLTKRLFRNYWRDPSYYYGKLFLSALIGIFNGFNRMFSAFLIVLLPAIVVNSVIPKFYMNRALWEFREHPSRIYGWFAFCTANIICEIPAAIVTGLVYWLFWYFPVGYPTDSGTAGYTFLMTMLFFLFQASWGQWICAFAPSFTVISNVLSIFFVAFNLFNGIMRQYASYPVFWKYWLYYLNPVTWWMRGILAAVLPAAKIVCTSAEATHFDPPPGSTCGEYAGPFVDTAGVGYLANVDATVDCQYCPFKDGLRIRRWSFGLWIVFGLGDKVYFVAYGCLATFYVFS